MTASALRMAGSQRGAATLAVVMVLFFILAMVAAYTNRNLIFEQRTSANSYRSARALAAADAGVDWTIAMLNGGIIGPDCTAAGATDDFRTRYLSLQFDGTYLANKWPAISPTDPEQAQPACAATDPATGTGAWDCRCPLGPPALLDHANAANPVFAVNFGAPDKPGVTVLHLQACNSARSGTVTGANMNAFGACHVNDIDSTDPSRQARLAVDSSATIRVSLGLLSALPNSPTAAMTVVGTITQPLGTTLRAVNADPSTGLALRAGGAIGNPAAIQAVGPAGSTFSTQRPGDSDLNSVAAADFFRQVFGMPAANYSQQPAAVILDCGGGCGAAASLTTAATQNPTRIIFVDGNLTFDAAAAYGSASQPTMLVATGNVTVAQPITFNGVIFAGGNLTWSSAGGVVNGAVIVGGNYTGTGDAAVAYDRAIVERVRQFYGSFVRVPGSWNTEKR
ncbi:hypothetical protein HLB44_28255 [Aquincola sp. S2]|uniref:Type 4 fimbrial biogenesis protein PilX N-terminal domain-containing protein n=1 Tax=Pseudaquabacterium terrae TaxID=2732868 RepID=A0ABX2EQC5_9BURK|nr:PilX N-terminal domain-containing pilus assembly protein [Aquabacterium terrae]NRF70905.1 hypothetical protein [Aquabacterium terrae]